MSIVIDGRKNADQLMSELGVLTQVFHKETGKRPGLAVLRIGENPASKLYVEKKGRAASELGYLFEEHAFPENITNAFLEAKIKRLNADDNIHGIIIQLPLPQHLDTPGLLSLIDPSKDVDGLHPLNAGRLCEGFSPLFTPCAPLACLSLIQTVEQNLEGLNVGIVGSSFLVGKPMAMLMLQQDCTVCMGHIKTRNLSDLCKTSDILVVAIGCPNFIPGNWIKKGAIVIDVGVNRLPSGKLAGDVDFVSAQKRAKAITPVPGGVGPMTVAILMRNTLEAAYNFVDISFSLSWGNGNELARKTYKS